MKINVRKSPVINLREKRKLYADCEPYGNSPSGEAAQTPAHSISKRGLGREARRGLCPLEIGRAHV